MNLAGMFLKSVKPIAEAIAKQRLLEGECIKQGDQRIAITRLAGVEIMRMVIDE